MQSDEVLYKCIHKFNAKDAVFISKVADKKLHMLMRCFTVLFLYIRLRNLDVNTFMVGYNFISTVIFIIFLIFTWNVMTINAYLLGKKLNINGQPINIFFYKDYFKINSKDEMGYSMKIIEYGSISKLVVIRGKLIIESNDPIDYTVLNNEDFIIGNMEELINFLSNR